MVVAEHDPSNPNESESGGSSSRSFPLIPLLNSIALLATAGFFYYSKLVFKRPKITELGERQRLVEAHATPTPPPTPMFVPFEPITVNIKATPEQPLPADGTFSQLKGKLHFITIGFSIEIRDHSQLPVIENVRPFILDKLVQTLGKKQFHELTTVQGRYVLTSEIVDFTNHFIASRSTTPSKDPLVTNVYFTQFLVQ